MKTARARTVCRADSIGDLPHKHCLRVVQPHGEFRSPILRSVRLFFRQRFIVAAVARSSLSRGRGAQGGIFDFLGEPRNSVRSNADVLAAKIWCTATRDGRITGAFYSSHIEERALTEAPSHGGCSAPCLRGSVRYLHARGFEDRRQLERMTRRRQFSIVRPRRKRVTCHG
jgi:hypothetical protein